MIIADDLNWNDLGAYGHPTIRTPNIDALASEGMRFTRAYLTANSCSPSRASIITGKYPHNTGAEQLHWPLPGEAVTFVERLTASGYYTAAAGKWHMGEAIKDRFVDVVEASVSGFQLPSGEQGAQPRMVADRPSGCEDWQPVLENRPKDRPFFLWLAALDPHRAYQEGALDPPHYPSDVVVPAHLPDIPEVRDDLQMYYDEIGRLDEYVGKVMAELEKQEVADNTVIFFISDNGRPFPRDKTTLFDGGIRTPWIVRWPGEVAGGTVSHSLVSAIDLAPTMLALARIASPPASMEGVSILPVLRDPATSVRDAVFAEDHWHDYEDHGRAVFDGRYKLIRNDYPDLPATPPADAGRSPTWQTMRKLHAEGRLTDLQQYCFRSPRARYALFDLASDPDEQFNLVDDPAYARIRSRLIDALKV